MNFFGSRLQRESEVNIHQDSFFATSWNLILELTLQQIGKLSKIFLDTMRIIPNSDFARDRMGNWNWDIHRKIFACNYLQITLWVVFWVCCTTIKDYVLRTIWVSIEYIPWLLSTIHCVANFHFPLCNFIWRWSLFYVRAYCINSLRLRLSPLGGHHISAQWFYCPAMWIHQSLVCDLFKCIHERPLFLFTIMSMLSD